MRSPARTFRSADAPARNPHRGGAGAGVRGGRRWPLRGWVVLVCLFALAPRPAQAQGSDAGTVPVPAVVEGRLHDITFDPAFPGDDRFESCGLARGGLVRSGDLDAIRTRLRAQGTFEAPFDVRLEPAQDGSVVLVATGLRRLKVRALAFEGVSQRSVDQARNDLAVVEGHWLSEPERLLAVARLVRAYRDAGFPSATVSATWRPTDDPTEGVLLVQVEEHAAVTVRRVTVVGTPIGLDDDVRLAVRLGRGDRADPQRLETAPARAIPVLRQSGYYGATVEPVRLLPVEGESDHVDAIVTVHAGPRYRIVWRGARAFPAADLELALHLDEEGPLEPATLSVLAGRVRAFYERRAFLDARVRVTIEETNEPGVRALAFRVEEGHQVLVRRVTFEGASGLTPARLRDVLLEVLYAELPGGQLLTDPGEAAEASIDGPGLRDPSRPEGRTDRVVPRPVRLNPDDTFVADLYVEAARRMVARYRDAGFLDARVTGPETTRGTDGDGRPVLDVWYTVTEGPRTQMDEIRFEGNTAFASAQLATVSGLRLGLPMSYSDVETARTALVEHYRREGYLFARITPAVDRSGDGSVGRVRFGVHEGPLVHLRRGTVVVPGCGESGFAAGVVVRGADHTLECVVRSRVRIAGGDVIRPEVLQTAQRQIAELGVYAAVTVTIRDPETESPEKDVVVQLLELRPQYLELRGGVSLAEGLRAGLEYGYRNIGGRAISFATSGQISVLWVLPALYPSIPWTVGDLFRYRITGSLLFPWLPNVGPTLRTSLDATFSRVLDGLYSGTLGGSVVRANGFAIDSQTVSFSGIWRPSQNFTLTLTPELQRATLRLFNETGIEEFLRDVMSVSGASEVYRLGRLLLLPRGATVLTAARVSALYDRRDQVINPQSGWSLGGLLEFVHVLLYQRPEGETATSGAAPGDTFRATLNLTGYIPIAIPRFGTIVLATNLRGGLNVHTSACPDVTYPNRLYFLGGADSMRGWLQDALVPQDLLDGKGDRCSAGGSGTTTGSMTYVPDVALAQRGGDVFLNWRNEIRIPIGSTGFVIAGFLDVGNLWRSLTNVEPWKLRAAAGAGIRFVTPIGPLALDYGWILNPVPGVEQQANSAPAGALSFSVGVF